jgi:hypothetical protein
LLWLLLLWPGNRSPRSQKKEGPKINPEWLRTFMLVGGIALSMIGGY